MTKSPVPSTSARKRLENIDQTSDALSRLSLSPLLSRKSFAHSVVFEASSSHRERQEGAVLPRPGSRHSSVTLSAAGSPRFSVLPSVGTEQNFDVYEFEIDNALNLMNIGGTPALREHQASAIAHALNNQNIFLALATGAGKSLCFRIPAIIQARHHHQVTVVLQPTLEIISFPKPSTMTYSYTRSSTRTTTNNGWSTGTREPRQQRPRQNNLRPLSALPRTGKYAT